MQILERKYNDLKIDFSFDEVIYLNATKTAKLFNTKPDNWLRNKDAKEYIEALKNRFSNLRNEELVIKKQGGKANEQGTWIHKSLIILFARWLNPDFAIWCDLQIEEILKFQTQETSQKPQPNQNIINNIYALEKSFENLRPSEASKIIMTEKLYQRLDLETCYLPQYTEEKLTRSLTYLLKKYEIKISTQKANLKLLEVGILEKMERDSSCGNKKYFYSLTENGLKYGKNLISPKNERETQPHFYEDKFLELLKLF
jgi:hypothetical protein